MKIIHNKHPFFNITIENIFSDKKLQKILNQIKSLKGEFESEKNTGSATDFYGNTLKKNKGKFLIKLKNCDNIKITEEIDLILKKLFTNESWNNNTFKRLFRSLMWGSELINYYENKDYYLPHTDDGIFTLIIWLYDDELTSFNGGDLYFPEFDYLHECKNNHGILFFSQELHGVTPIISSPNNFGRYSVVSFSDYKPQNNKRFRSNFESNLLYQ